MRSFFWIGLWAALAGTLLAPATSADGVGSQMRAQDARLSTPVTVSARRVYLGELLDDLARQSHIAIAAQDGESSSGIQVTVACKAVPVADLMDALWSLLSLHDFEWQWQRTGSPGKYAYTLVEPEAARSSAQRLRVLAQQALERCVAVMAKLAAMSPDERQRHAALLAEAFMQKDDEDVEGVLHSNLDWEFVRLFAQSLAPDVAARVLRGELRAKVAVSSLPQDQQDLLNRVWAQENIHATENGVEVHLQEPSSLVFYATQGATRVHDLALTPWVFLGEHVGSFSVTPALFLDRGIAAEIRRMWMQPGDAASGPSESDEIPVHPAFATGQSPPAMAPLDERLIEISSATGTPVVALAPDAKSENDFPMPFGQRVGQYLAAIRAKQVMPMWKYRGSILVVCYPAWFEEDQNALPYGLLRKYLRGGNQLIPLQDLVKLMVAQQAYDTRALEEQNPALAAAEEFRPVFLLYEKDPSLITPRGMPLNFALIQSLRQAVPALAGRLKDTDAGLRLRQRTSSTQDGRILTITIEALPAGTKRWRPLVGMAETVPGEQPPP